MTITVTDADREAAAKWLSQCPAIGDRVLAGENDSHGYVQAFASHRITSIAPLVEAMEGLTGLFEAIREDSISTHFRFGATEAERKNRIQQLLGFIEANADKVDDALEVAFAALSRIKGDGR